MTRTKHPQKKTKAPRTWRWLFPVLSLGLGLQALSAQDEPAPEAPAPPPDYGEPASFSEFFNASEPEGWNFRSVVPERENVLRYVPRGNEEGESPGFHFYTNAKAYFWKEWDVGLRPFVLDFNATLDLGRKRAWRLNGLTVMVSTAPAHKMGVRDYGIALSIQQQGIQAAVKTGFHDPFQDREIEPIFKEPRPHKTLGYVDAAPPGVLSRGGSGGHSYSSGWHKKRLNDEDMWFRMERTEDGYVKFAYYHEDADPSAPVWRAVWKLPDEVTERAYRENGRRYDVDFDRYGKPLKYVNVFTTTNNHYGNTEEQYDPLIHDGRVTHISGITAPGKLPSIDRYFGVVENGATLTLTGEAFQEGARVTLNGKELTTRVLGSDRLEAELAHVEPGENKLAVYNPDGGATFMASPLRTGQVVEQVLPAELRLVGDEVITLKGYGFTEGTEVFFDGEPVEIVELVSGQELKIRTLRAETGRVELAVRDGGRDFTVEPVVAYAKHPDVLISESQLEHLRERFEHPDMKHYRKVIMKNAEARKGRRYNNPRAFLKPDYGYSIIATAFAYAFTGDPQWKALTLHFIEGTTGPSDMLASLDPTYQEEQAAKQREAQKKGEQLTTAAVTSWGAGIPVQVLSMDDWHLSRGLGLAYAYELLYDELTPAMRGRMLTYMQRMVDFHLERIEQNDWFHMNNPSNTTIVGNGIPGLIALSHRALRDDTEGLVKQLAGNMKKIFTAVTADGGNVEGPMYWNLGFLYQILLGEAAEKAFGTDFDLLADPRLDKGVDFAQAVLGGAGEMFCWNDTQPILGGTVPAATQADEEPFMRWLVDAIMERNATLDFPWEKDWMVPQTTRPIYVVGALIMRGDKPPLSTMPPLPTLKVLPVTHIAAMRSTPDAHEQGVVAGIKGKGGVTTHHAHGDQGGYVLHAHGERFLIDPGYGYADPELHSVPLILEETTNKKGKRKTAAHGPHRNYNVPLMDGRESGDIRTIRADATPAYISGKGKTQHAKKAKRVYTLVGEEAFVVLDDVLPAESGQKVRFQYQLESKPELDQAARSFGLAVNGKQTSAHIFGPESTEMTMKQQKRAKGWIWKRMGLRTFYGVRGDYTPKADHPLITVFQPTKGLEPAPAPEVDYDGDEITVTLGSGRELDFARVDGDWVLTTI